MKRNCPIQAGCRCIAIEGVHSLSPRCVYSVVVALLRVYTALRHLFRPVPSRGPSLAIGDKFPDFPSRSPSRATSLIVGECTDHRPSLGTSYAVPHAQGELSRSRRGGGLNGRMPCLCVILRPCALRRWSAPAARSRFASAGYRARPPSPGDRTPCALALREACAGCPFERMLPAPNRPGYATVLCAPCTCAWCTPLPPPPYCIYGAGVLIRLVAAACAGRQTAPRNRCALPGALPRRALRRPARHGAYTL